MAQIHNVLSNARTVALRLGQKHDEESNSHFVYLDDVIYIEADPTSALVRVSVSKIESSDFIWNPVLDCDSTGCLSTWLTFERIQHPETQEWMDWIGYIEDTLLPECGANHTPSIGAAHLSDLLLLEAITTFLSEWITWVVQAEVNRQTAMQALIESLEAFIAYTRTDVDAFDLIRQARGALALANGEFEYQINIRYKPEGV